MGSISADAAVRQARIDMAAAHRLAVRDGLNEGSWNHLSMTVPGKPDHILVTPSYTHWSQVTASSLVEVGPGAKPEDMDSSSWIAYRIHYPLHAARPSAVVVMHTHAPYVNAMAMVGAKLNNADQSANFFFDRVAYTEDYDGLYSNLEQGAFMARALGDKAFVLFLKNHGAVITGPTVGHCYTSMLLLELACKKQILAMSTGLPLIPVPHDRLKPRDYQDKDFRWQHFEAMKRVLDKTEPDYADLS